MDHNLVTSISTRQSIAAQGSPKIDSRGGGAAVAEASRAQARPVSSGAIEKDIEAAQKQLEASVSRLNEFVQSVQRDLEFSIDELSGETVIKVMDSQTEEIIRQIPSEEVLALSRNIETLKGVLFSAEV